jgi:hypothetical protein
LVFVEKMGVKASGQVEGTSPLLRKLISWLISEYLGLGFATGTRPLAFRAVFALAIALMLIGIC